MPNLVTLTICKSLSESCYREHNNIFLCISIKCLSHIRPKPTVVPVCDPDYKEHDRDITQVALKWQGLDFQIQMT